MKFSIDKLILWLKNDKRKELQFEPNKVNVITGDSNTGKTAILEIIDYCFFASKSKISESVINENVSWYGIRICINDKIYTIGREALKKGVVSDNYYFSSTGEIPNQLEPNNTENTIKAAIETEFNIDKKVSIPYGSYQIKAGSKISLRYFLLFNTISVNIIETDTGVFFDKQNQSRYRDALPRIFDLALGIETVENVLKKEKRAQLEKQLSALEKKNEIIHEKSDAFKEEKKSIVKLAKEYSLISSDLDLEASILEIQKIISGVNVKVTDGNEREIIERNLNLKERKIRNLKRFSSEYNSFKNNLKSLEDSLKPIQYLKEKDEELIKTSIFDSILERFSTEIRSIRDARKSKTPVDNQVNDAIRQLENEALQLQEELSIRPDLNRNFETEKEKYFFLGEVKSKIDLYASKKSSPTTIPKETKKLQEQIDSIKIEDTKQKKELVIKLIEEIISEYIEVADTALENYRNYRPVFDYKEKSLLLRKPKTSFIENVGSSSNHMFLHLFFSLAMHEAAFQNDSPFVAPYLIIDQPSRPYYGDDKTQRKKFKGKSDTAKITKAFELLDKFIDSRSKSKDDNSETENEFQMIVFEHIPPQLIRKFKNIHLFDDFSEGNALIPESMLEELSQKS